MSKQEVRNAVYLNKCRRDYSLYVLQQRAVPHIADGMKSSTRRVMWTARDGNKWKSATLAGACMPLHPHAMPEDAVNTLAAHYGNNNPLLDGIGSFGTRLDPTAYGASRYTSVKVSEFAKDAFYTDIELLPMKPNYDNTLEEPVHFLPLVPMSLINPTSGIAVGFACDIFPRALNDIIDAQIKYLNGINVKKEPLVHYTKLGCKAVDKVDDKWIFRGEIERVNTTTIKIKNYPASITHDKLTDRLIKLVESGKMVDYDDDSKDSVDITCKFRRDQLIKMDSDDKLLDLFGLLKSEKENINMINFDGTSVISPTPLEVIELFTDWRLTWYLNRYTRLADIEQKKIQQMQDIITAIDNDAGSKATKVKNRDDFKTWLNSIGVVNLDYITNLAVYRFTKEEKKKVEDKLKESKKILKQYNDLIKDPQLRKDQYVQELTDLKKKHG